MTDPVNALIDEAQAYVLEKRPGWDLMQRLAEEIQALRRGEFICQKCGHRKDGEKVDADF